MLSASKNLLPVSLSLLPVFRAAHPARSAPALRPAPLQNWFNNQYRKEQKALPAPDAVAPRRAAASRSQDKTFAPDLRLCQSVLPVSTPSSCGIQDDLDTMAQADEPGAPAEEPAVDAILPAPRGAPQPVLAPDRGDQSSSGRRRFTAACTTLLNFESGPAQIAAQAAPHCGGACRCSCTRRCCRGHVGCERLLCTPWVLVRGLRVSVRATVCCSVKMSVYCRVYCVKYVAQATFKVAANSSRS